MAKARKYFSERHGRGPKAEPMPYETVRRLVMSVVRTLEGQGYFQEALGYECVDEGFVPGSVGPDISAFWIRTLMREDVWPWEHNHPQAPADPWTTWEPDVLFDVVEVLHDIVAKPLKGRHHDYYDCGWHYSTFDQDAGRVEFREQLNKVLPLGDPAYEINLNGEVIEAAPDEFKAMLSAAVPPETEQEAVVAKMEAAKRLFAARGASVVDRQHAVRDLADVLEYLRQDMKDVMLSEDESALFNIANNFGIRHHRRGQKIDYDRVTWLRWRFYVYLATIHATLRVRRSARA